MRLVFGGSSGKHWGGKSLCRHHRASNGPGPGQENNWLRILVTIVLFLDWHTCVLGNVNFDPTQTYITYYHNWLRMAVIGILPFSAICCLNLRIFLAVSWSKYEIIEMDHKRLSGLRMELFSSCLRRCDNVGSREHFWCYDEVPEMRPLSLRSN